MWESKSTSLRKGARAFGSALYYLFCCPLIEPRRTVEFLKSVYFYKQAESILRIAQTVIPTVPPEDLFPGLFARPVQALELGGTQHANPTPYESYLLACIVQSLRPRTLFEFGTFEGRTTLQLALNSPPDAIIYTLDLPEDYGSTHYARSYPDEDRVRRWPIGGSFQRYAISRKIRQLFADSASADYKYLRGGVDFIFIDADHGYEYVKSDSENAVSMMSPHAVILWHDYGSKWKDVTLFLYELAVRERKNIYHLEGTNLAIYAPAISLPRQPEVANASTVATNCQPATGMSRSVAPCAPKRAGI